MKLGLAGFGQIGRPIAMNLLRAGAELVVHDRSGRHLEAFRQAGAQATGDLAGLADAEVVFLCLPNAEVVQHVLLGVDGLLRRMARGQAVVDLSTLTPAATARIGRQVEAAA